MSTIFQDIIDGKVPCNKVYEDELFLSFHDLYPQAPVHILIVPKKPLKNIGEAQEEDSLMLGKALILATQLAKKFGVEKGYRVLTNVGHDAGQTIFHIHFHLLGGCPLENLR
jgi:histidine triad (HIT) family protein